jgi:hypothetical protein
MDNARRLTKSGERHASRNCRFPLVLSAAEVRATAHFLLLTEMVIIVSGNNEVRTVTDIVLNFANSAIAQAAWGPPR